MKRIIIVLSLTIVSVPLYAGWSRAYGEGRGTYVRQTEDGGFIIAGTELIKTDQEGEVQWRKDYDNYYYCLDETTDGGYIVLSSKRNEQTDDVQMWILKLDSAGDTAWTGLYGEDVLVRGGYIEQMSDGGYVAVCESFVRTDSIGNFIFIEDYRPILSIFCSSNNYCEDHYIITSYDTLMEVDNTGQIIKEVQIFFGMNFGPEYIHRGHTGYVAVGNDWGLGSDTNPNFDCYVAEYDESGYKLWDDTWGGPEFLEEAYCVQPLPPDSITTFTGWYIVCGTNSLRKYALYYYEYDKHLEWHREFDGILYHVEQTSDNGYIITGERNDEILLIKTDSLGNVGVEEEMAGQLEPDFHLSPIDSEIVLSYEDRPQGFRADIFDASGRRVDVLHSSEESGVLTWGAGFSPGVYFIREASVGTARRVLIVK